jgi:hypothetical protein
MTTERCNRTHSIDYLPARLNGGKYSIRVNTATEEDTSTSFDQPVDQELIKLGYVSLPWDAGHGQRTFALYRDCSRTQQQASCAYHPSQAGNCRHAVRHREAYGLLEEYRVVSKP